MFKLRIEKAAGSGSALKNKQLDQDPDPQKWMRIHSPGWTVKHEFIYGCLSVHYCQASFRYIYLRCKRALFLFKYINLTYWFTIWKCLFRWYICWHFRFLPTYLSFFCVFKDRYFISMEPHLFYAIEFGACAVSVFG